MEGCKAASAESVQCAVLKRDPSEGESLLKNKRGKGLHSAALNEVPPFLNMQKLTSKENYFLKVIGYNVSSSKKKKKRGQEQRGNRKFSLKQE